MSLFDKVTTLVNAFATGSRVYGTPRPDSDLDLVVLVDSDDLARLRELADKTDTVEQEPDDKSYPSDSLRFGKLNLICISSHAVFEAWRKATDSLALRRPVTRDEAVACIKAEVAKVGGAS